MDCTFYKHKNGVLHIPEGLNELLFDISREVLRQQPELIYEFIANYLSSLLITRDRALLSPDSPNDDSIRESETVKALIDIGLCSLDAQKIHALLLEYFSSCKFPYVAEKKILEDIMCVTNIAGTQINDLINIVRRAYVLHCRHSVLTEESNKETGACMSKKVPCTWNSIIHYNPINISLTDLNKAATTIQAAYRGYRVRRLSINNIPNKMKETYDMREETLEHSINFPSYARDISDASVWTWRSNIYQTHKQ